LLACLLLAAAATSPTPFLSSTHHHPPIGVEGYDTVAVTMTFFHFLLFIPLQISFRIKQASTHYKTKFFFLSLSQEQEELRTKNYV
jgi:hypothetical protein